MTPYNPFDWHWSVGNDPRYYSSAVHDYVDTLPEGAVATRIASEQELWKVLRAAGVLPSPRTIHMTWLRLALIEIDKLDAVQAAVAAQGPVKQTLWEYATTIMEEDEDVAAIAGALSIDLADLFDRAESIRDQRQA